MSNYLGVGSVLYNTYIEGGSRRTVKLNEHLGAAEWESFTVPQVSQADSLAGQGANLYLGSFPSFVHGSAGRLLELAVSLEPREPGARPILHIAITQKPKYAKTLKEIKISLGAHPNKLDVSDGLATSERTADRGFPVGQLKLTPVNGRSVALPIIVRQGNFSVRAKGRRARNLTRRLTLDMYNGELTIRGLPRKRLKRISIKLDGRRGGLLRNPKKCEPVVFYGDITSRSSGKLHASKLVKLRCRK